MPYLYAYAGQAWKTQRTVRLLLDTTYANAPEGLAGNEDCGQMSAWYVLSALGFYPVRPAGGDYVVGTPLFPEAVVSLENGRRLVVRAPVTSSSARYVTALEFDGKPHDRAWLTDAMIARGGELTFAMSDTPATAWAAGPNARPHSAITAPLVTPVPFVMSGRPLFRGTTEGDGGLTVWIDGVQKAGLTGVDKDTRRVDRARLGATGGVDTGTRGTYTFDAFESRHQSYIGP